MTLDRREIVSLDLPADLHTVWAHLREPDLVRRWFGWDYDGLDAEIRDYFVGSPVVAQSADGDNLVHTLTTPSHDVLAVTAASHDPGHTHLTITRSSHDGLASYDGVYDPIDEGWIQFAQQLRFALRAHRGQERRTLSVFGLDAGDRRDRLLDRAGLHGVRGIPVGGHVQARRPDGTLLGGTLVYKEEHQFGLQLHGITESFLVILETPVASHPPHGTVGAVLSTYGIDESTFAEVEERWSGWWSRSQPHGTAVGA